MQTKRAEIRERLKCEEQRRHRLSEQYQRQMASSQILLEAGDEINQQAYKTLLRIKAWLWS